MGHSTEPIQLPKRPRHSWLRGYQGMVVRGLGAAFCLGFTLNGALARPDRFNVILIVVEVLTTTALMRPLLPIAKGWDKVWEILHPEGEVSDA